MWNISINKYPLFFVILMMATTGYAQTVEVVKEDQLYTMIDTCDDEYDICLYNFWATWCAPCIRELPHFEALNNSDKRVKVHLVSMDAVEDLHSKVQPFIRKRGMKSSVFLLDETDFNEIIPSISKEWTGAIPATLIVDNKSGQKYFYEKEFKDNELEIAIEKVLTINN